MRPRKIGGADRRCLEVFAYGWGSTTASTVHETFSASAEKLRSRNITVRPRGSGRQTLAGEQRLMRSPITSGNVFPTGMRLAYGVARPTSYTSNAENRQVRVLVSPTSAGDPSWSRCETGGQASGHRCGTIWILDTS